jgi:hypothetical protein
MMYLWDDPLKLFSIPAMELLNRAWASVQRSCFKSSEAYDKAVVRNMKKAGLIIVLNLAHDPVDFDNLNAEVFADYMVYLAERRTTVIRTSFDGKRSALYHLYRFLSPSVFAHDEFPTATRGVWNEVADSSASTRAWWEGDIR